MVLQNKIILVTYLYEELSIIIILLLMSFSQVLFHWNLRFPVLSIWTNLNNAVVLIVPQIFTSHSFFSKPLGTVPRALTTIGIKVILICYSLFNSVANFKYLSIFLLFSFSLWSWLEWQNLSSFFIVNISLVFGLRFGDLFVSQNYCDEYFLSALNFSFNFFYY